MVTGTHLILTTFQSDYERLRRYNLFNTYRKHFLDSIVTTAEIVGNYVKPMEIALHIRRWMPYWKEVVENPVIQIPGSPGDESEEENKTQIS